MPEGKHFFIKSKLNELVLDITGASEEPGTPVVTWFQKDEGFDNQLWYEDHLTGTIRSKLNDFCLDLTDDDTLVVNPYDSDRASSQQWLTAGDRIQMRSDSDRVLDISGEERSEGAKVIAYNSHDGENQKWSFHHVPARFFYLCSKMHGKVLDIKRKNDSPGSKAIMMDKAGDAEDNQLWYEDKHCIICSKLNDFVLDASDDDKIRLNPYEAGNPKQLWTLQEDRIINRVEPNHALDIKGAAHKNGAKLLSYPWNGQDNQKWEQEFI